VASKMHIPMRDRLDCQSPKKFWLNVCSTILANSWKRWSARFCCSLENNLANLSRISYYGQVHLSALSPWFLVLWWTFWEKMGEAISAAENGATDKQFKRLGIGAQILCQPNMLICLYLVVFCCLNCCINNPIPRLFLWVF
jgi:hypothetical protein